MAKTPYLFSDDLVSTIKRKILVPVTQNTFSSDDFLAFCDDEMELSQVPSVLQFNEEYYVFSQKLPMLPDQPRYEIPNRAIGLKLRDVFYEDNSGSLYEMTKTSPDDKSWFQNSSGISTPNPYAYYIEGNDIVLNVKPSVSVTGFIRVSFYMRPNKLVLKERAAFIQSLKKTITLSSVVAGDQISIDSTTFTAVSSSPGTNQFLVGVDDTATATNLASAITSSGLGTATSNAAVITFLYNSVKTLTTGNSTITIQSTTSLVFTQALNSIFTSGVSVDFLQTLGGHKIRNYNVTSGVVDSTTQITFNDDDIDKNLVSGDYICLSYECCIPFIPDDLHSGLAERAASRILAAIGDVEGSQVSMAKVREIDQAQKQLLDNRVDGSYTKVFNKRSLYRAGRLGRGRSWG
jgi:hypothetical protein